MLFDNNCVSVIPGDRKWNTTFDHLLYVDSMPNSSHPSWCTREMCPCLCNFLEALWLKSCRNALFAGSEEDANQLFPNSPCTELDIGSLPSHRHRSVGLPPPSSCWNHVWWTPPIQQPQPRNLAERCAICGVSERPEVHTGDVHDLSRYTLYGELPVAWS